VKILDYANGIQNTSSQELTIAQKILGEFLKVKRSISDCDENCHHCQVPHLDKVYESVRKNHPIEFVLPAFPGKSPNLNKVLGHLPDLAEEQSLIFLNSLCETIQEIYTPGAKIIICSDGRVFSDVVGMKEDHVTEYQMSIDSLITELKLSHLSTFHLDEIAPGESFEAIREALVLTHGRSIEQIRSDVKRGQAESAHSEIHRMYCGLVKFLVEDQLHPEIKISKSQIQKQSRKKAYHMIQRSNAWTNLIEELFPSAVRLSIHPQACGSKKLGIQLLGKETWMTPWHGVAVKIDGKLRLMKRWQAEELGANLVRDRNGKARYFEVAQ
tara:strand:+ start:13905 stop:14885 length:981 start_codon:yes stop_codon:yes gene_type:complete